MAALNQTAAAAAPRPAALRWYSGTRRSNNASARGSWPARACSSNSSIERARTEFATFSASRGGAAEPPLDPEAALGPLRELVDAAAVGIVVRAALPLSAQAAFAEAATRADRGARVVADAASGIVQVHLREDTGLIAAADALVANARVLEGNARIERSSLAGLDPFGGPAPAGAFLMRRLKDAFDPGGILEPARSAIG